MKLKLLIVAGFLMMCIACPAAFAQDYTKYEFSFGYSLMKVGEYDNIDTLKDNLSVSIGGQTLGMEKSNFLERGFSTSFAYNFTSNIGAEALVHYNAGYILSGNREVNDAKYELGFKKSDFSFLFGPRFKFKAGRVEPFIHGLAGFSRDGSSVVAEAKKDGESVDIGNSFKNEDLESHTSFGVVVGGGLDISINDNWAIRAVRADYYIVNSHPANLKTPSGINMTFPNENKPYNNLNLSFGVVYRWGR